MAAGGGPVGAAKHEIWNAESHQIRVNHRQTGTCHNPRHRSRHQRPNKQSGGIWLSTDWRPPKLVVAEQPPEFGGSFWLPPSNSSFHHRRNSDETVAAPPPHVPAATRTEWHSHFCARPCGILGNPEPNGDMVLRS